MIGDSESTYRRVRRKRDRADTNGYRNGTTEIVGNLYPALDGALRPLTPVSQAEATVLDDRTVRFFTVTTEGARYFGDQGLPISRPLGLSIRSAQAIVAVPARLAPADPAAAGLFALDHAVHHMLETPLSELTPRTAAQAVAGAVEIHQLAETAVTVDELRSELWRRRHFTPLYTLRAAEDFDYD
ncbi:hypothetical protein [Polymorphospora sp. NPDC050346]|uniref:hypothetical protein n=1 Tax=Polymorphospora sp. NPDC050346 TaxID=3155780 RepID=UPI0033D89610